MMYILKKHYKAFIFYIVLVLIALVLAIFVPVFSNKHKLGDEALRVTYFHDNLVTVSNLLPMTDDIGKTIGAENYKEGDIGYLEFEVSSVVDEKVNYEIYLTNEQDKSNIPVKFIKVLLTDDNDRILTSAKGASIPTYYELKVAESNPAGRLIYSGKIEEGTDKFRLRMWVADTYELTTVTKNFSVKVNVKVL